MVQTRSFESDRADPDRRGGDAAARRDRIRQPELCPPLNGVLDATQETLMAKHHYPKTDEHVAEHAAMIERALNYRISLDVNSARSVYGTRSFCRGVAVLPHPLL